MKDSLGAISLTFVVSCLMASQVKADFVNGGFESGFTGWTAVSSGTGGASTDTSFSGFFPTEGSRFARAFSGGVGTSDVSQTFFGTAGESLRFDHFWTAEGSVGGPQDSNSVALDIVLTRPDLTTDQILDVNLTGNFVDETTSWVSVERILATSGDYILRFTVNTNTAGNASGNGNVGLDFVRVVPEPNGLSIVGLMLSLAVSAFRRRRLGHRNS